MTLKEAFASCGGQQTGGAPFSGRARKAARSRGAASSDAPTKAQRAGEAEVVDAEVLDLTAQVHLTALYATRGAGERPGGIDVLHFVPTKREQHRERHATRRQDPQRHGGKTNQA